MSKSFKVLVFSGVLLSIAVWIAVPFILSGYYLDWRAWSVVLFWILGGLMGYWVLEFDRLVDIYITRPDTKLALYTKDLIAKNQFRQAWAIIQKNKHLQPTLTFRSALFQVIWVALAFFTLTSTVSMFGKGFIIGLGLHLLLAEWENYQVDRAHLKGWLFWQINREITDKELKIYLWVMTGIMIWLVFMVV